MLQFLRLARPFGLALALPSLGAACATSGSRLGGAAEPNSDIAAAQHLALEMPAEAKQVRDNGSAPILSVVTIDRVVLPYVYGYPLFPEGEAARGVLALRKDNGAGARRADKEDADGVVHASEELPAIGCRFDGVRENPAKFVPVSLTCELPAPKALGGAKRPVLGSVSAGAKAEQILKEPTVQENFMGEFHLTSDDFATGSGIGYFNTTHGQLALVFSNKKLTRFVYYFDPTIAGWQNQSLWVKP